MSERRLGTKQGLGRTRLNAALVALAAMPSLLHAQCQDSQTKLLAADGQAGDGMGASIALLGELILVGSPQDQDQGPATGAAYLYQLEPAGWAQAQKLLASDAAASDNFGNDVAIGSDFLAVGAPQFFPSSEPGKVHIFTHDGTSWQETQRLTPADMPSMAAFGIALATDSQTLVIGADQPVSPDDVGLVYVFESVQGQWSQVARLSPDDGLGGDYFGTAVDVDGGTLVVGATGADTSGANSGAVYIFSRSGGVWQQETKLTAPDGAAGDFFGQSLAIVGDTILVAAPRHAERTGVVYVYERQAGNWAPSTTLNPDSLRAGAFGRSVAFDGTSALVGAPLANSLYGTSGILYFFNFDGQNWSRVRRLSTRDGNTADFFGFTSDVDGRWAVTGDIRNDDNGTNAGAAYAQDLSACLCPADFNDNGTLNTLDFLEYLNTFSAGDLAADLTGDGQVNTLDFLVYLNAYNEGCG